MGKCNRVFSYLFKVVPSFKFSTVRWGYFQLALSLFYFFFSAFLALFITWIVVREGGTMDVGIIIFLVLWIIALVFGITVFGYCVFLGIHWLRSSEDPTATKKDIDNVEVSIRKKLDNILGKVDKWRE